MRILMIICCVLAMSVHDRAPAEVEPARIDLLGVLSPSHDTASGFAINNLGQVVGGSFGSTSRAFRYSDGVGMVDLGSISPQHQAEAHDINDSGEAVGFSFGFGAEMGFRHNDGVGMSQVGPNHTAVGGTRVHGINNAGIATGYSYFSGVGQQGFVQSPGGALTPFGDSSTTPYAINSTGAVVGHSVASGTQHAFIRTPAGTMTFLTEPAGSNRSAAYDVNDADVFVGETWNNSLANTGAFVYSQTGGFERLMSLPGAASTAARGINELGWIVGWAEGSYPRTGVLWRPGMAPLNLTEYVHTVLGRPDVSILTAEDVNDVGQIVGQARVGTSAQRIAYRITIPAPGHAGVFMLGSTLIARQRRRKADGESGVRR